MLDLVTIDAISAGKGLRANIQAAMAAQTRT